MKKTQNKLSVFLPAVGLLLALAACGPKEASTPSSAPGSSATPEVQNTPDATASLGQGADAYEFLGEYHDLQEHSMDFYFLGQMGSDNTGVIYMANSNKSEDGTVTTHYEETPVTWSAETDRDGLVTFKAASQGEGNDFGEVSIYQEDDGTFPWEYKFEFAGGYSRTVTLVGSDTITYVSLDDWKAFVDSNAFGGETGDEGGETAKDTAYTFFGDAVKTEDGAVCENMGAQVTLYADGTAVAERGYAAGGSLAYVYTTDEGTWTQEGDTITISVADKTYTTEKTDDSYSFIWETSSEEEGALTVSMTCAG